MPVISGKSALVNGVSNVGRWKVQWTGTDAGIVHSSSEGVVVRLAGNMDWRGVYQAYGHTPATMPGAALTFAGKGSDGTGASGTAIVERADIFWDIATARPLYHNLYFAANGALTFASPAGSDGGYSVPLPSKGMSATWGGAAITNITQMRLSLISRNAPYVDSSATAGQVQRAEGNKDVEWMYRKNISAITDLPDTNAIAQLKMGVTAAVATFWDLKDAVVTHVEPIYDIEGTQNKRAKVVEAIVRGKHSMTTTFHYVANPATTKWLDFTD